jgi:hypothetical protein
VRRGLGVSETGLFYNHFATALFSPAQPISQPIQKRLTESSQGCPLAVIANSMDQENPNVGPGPDDNIFGSVCATHRRAYAHII